MDAFGDVADQILGFASSHIYVALFVLLLAEEAGVPLPIPGDTFILLAGAGVAQGDVNAWLALALIVVAAVAGSSNLYWLSRLGGWAVLRRVGRTVRLDEERLQRFGRWLRRRPVLAVVGGRLTPGLRIVTSIAAGTFALPYAAFVASTAVAALIWGMIYLLVGALAQNAYRSLAGQVPGPLALLVLVFAVAAAVAAVRRRRPAPPTSEGPS